MKDLSVMDPPDLAPARMTALTSGTAAAGRRRRQQGERGWRPRRPSAHLWPGRPCGRPAQPQPAWRRRRRAMPEQGASRMLKLAACLGAPLAPPRTLHQPGRGGPATAAAERVGAPNLDRIEQRTGLPAERRTTCSQQAARLEVVEACWPGRVAATRRPTELLAVRTGGAARGRGSSSCTPACPRGRERESSSG